MKILALAGGVGGAKLCFGLANILTPDELHIVVNTGDDEEFYGLHVSPDLDTVMYTLAGMSNPETGWGIVGESYTTLKSLERLGQNPWFGLGDQDMATHMVRSEMLERNCSLSEVTRFLCRWLGVDHPVSPMTDDRVRTMVKTEIGWLSFQTYFVKLRCEPKIEELKFVGCESATMSAAFQEGLSTADALVICPSNPYLSIAPIMSVRGVRCGTEQFEGPRIAVSPIVGGQAIKGPAAKILAELGEDVSCTGVARQYAGLCDLFVIDEVDRDLYDEVQELGMTPVVLNTVMNTESDKMELARGVLNAIDAS